jgi:hypothetical protein
MTDYILMGYAPTSSIPSVISFPNASKAAQALQAKKGTTRRLTVPARFVSYFSRLLKRTGVS